MIRSVHPRFHGGAPGLAREGPGGLRSIPAFTGEPKRNSSKPRRKRVHPRFHGGAVTYRTTRAGRGGPSPLSRGSHGKRQAADPATRSIPAFTGEPYGDAGTLPHRPVHPRFHGGAASSWLSSSSRSGPSPLSRGSHRRRCVAADHPGSIPAFTGEPTGASVSSEGERVHPRFHGGAPAASASVATVQGPSPLSRGSRSVRAGLPATAGSIPAFTGEPGIFSLRRRSHGVHPRFHGGACPEQWHFRGGHGPSPLSRGSRAMIYPKTAAVGSIPAFTGEPAASISSRRAA